MAEVFAESPKVVLSDRGSMLIGSIVSDARSVTLAVLENGTCVAALAGSRDWFAVEMVLQGENWLMTAEIEPLTEIERFP